MRFDFCIGNPPYHYETGRRKIPIYQHFIMAATNPEIARHTCFITPDGFVKGGQQLEPLRDYLINTKHLKKVIFHRGSVFNDVSVSAAVTLYDNEIVHNDVEKVILNTDGSIENGSLDWQYRDVVIDEFKYQILKLYETKVACKDNMSLIIPGRGPFGLCTKCYKSNIEKFKTAYDVEHPLKILVGVNCDFFWINPSDDFSYEGSDGSNETLKLEKINKWKMVFPKAGYVKNKHLPTRILEPGVIFTDKYLCIFGDSRLEVENAEKYFNSKFYRAGLYSKMTSWILVRNWHVNLPIQNFTNLSDIDWSLSSADIDLQLYKKYNFSDDEIRLVEDNVYSME